MCHDKLLCKRMAQTVTPIETLTNEMTHTSGWAFDRLWAWELSKSRESIRTTTARILIRMNLSNFSFRPYTTTSKRNPFLLHLTIFALLFWCRILFFGPFSDVGLLNTCLVRPCFCHWTIFNRFSLRTSRSEVGDWERKKRNEKRKTFVDLRWCVLSRFDFAHVKKKWTEEKKQS